MPAATRLALTCLAAALATLPAAGRAQASDMARILETLASDSPADYTAVLDRFVACAVKGDLDGMIALTSPITVEQAGGAEKLRALFRDDLSVALRQFPKRGQAGNRRYVKDPDGTTGWIIETWFSSEDGKKKAPLRFTVLKEEGQIRVSYFGIWQEALDRTEAAAARKDAGEAAGEKAKAP